jgi:hypothetical protein
MIWFTGGALLSRPAEPIAGSVRAPCTSACVLWRRLFGHVSRGLLTRATWPVAETRRRVELGRATTRMGSLFSYFSCGRSAARGHGAVELPPRDESHMLENQSGETLRLFSDKAGPLASLGPGQAAEVSRIRARHGGSVLRAVSMSGETVLQLTYNELPVTKPSLIVVSEAQVRAAKEAVALFNDRRARAEVRERQAATTAQSAWRRWRLSRQRLCSGCFREVPAGLSARSSHRCPHHVCLGCVTDSVRLWDAMSGESPRCPEPGCACALEPSATSRAAVPFAALEAFFDGVERAFALFDATVDRRSLWALCEANRRWLGCRHTVVLAYERGCCSLLHGPRHMCSSGGSAVVHVRNEASLHCELLVSRGQRKNEEVYRLKGNEEKSVSLDREGTGQAETTVLILREPRSKVQLAYREMSGYDGGDTAELVLVVADRERPKSLTLLRRLAATAIQACARGRQCRKLTTCRICLADLPLHTTAYVTRACKHRFCRACIAAHIEQGSDKLRLRCPEPGCLIELRQGDVSRFVPGLDRVKRLAAAHDRYREALSTAEQDRPFFDWALANARVCPCCKVLLVKDEGCDSIVCTCGGVFNYQSSRLQPRNRVLVSNTAAPASQLNRLYGLLRHTIASSRVSSS